VLHRDLLAHTPISFLADLSSALWHPNNHEHRLRVLWRANIVWQRQHPTRYSCSVSRHNTAADSADDGNDKLSVGENVVGSKRLAKFANPSEHVFADYCVVATIVYRAQLAITDECTPVTFRQRNTTARTEVLETQGGDLGVIPRRKWPQATSVPFVTGKPDNFESRTTVWVTPVARFVMLITGPLESQPDCCARHLTSSQRSMRCYAVVRASDYFGAALRKESDFQQGGGKATAVISLRLSAMPAGPGQRISVERNPRQWGTHSATL
jgi:hypothetical protein